MDRIKDWSEIQDDFKRVMSMSCKPSFSKLPSNYITDEDKSVKWNREQVVLNNKAYEKAVAELNTARNKARDAVYEDIYCLIQDEVGYNLSRESAMAIWEHAYASGHSGGINDIRCYLNDYMDLVVKVLTYERKK